MSDDGICPQMVFNDDIKLNKKGALKQTEKNSLFFFPTLLFRLLYEDYVTNPNAKGQFIVLTSLSLRADTSLTLATRFVRMCEQLNDRHIDTSQAVPTACMPPPFPKHRMCTSLSDLTATAEQSVWTGQSLKMCWEKGNVTLVWRRAATGLKTSDFFFSAFLSN